MSRVNQGGKRDNQDGKFLAGVVFEPFWLGFDPLRDDSGPI